MKRSILVFGVGILQKSIIQRAKNMDLFVIGIDPSEDAYCKNFVDVFKIIGGQDFENTISLAKKYSVSAIITAATDKPLIMMAKLAKELGIFFYSIETACVSTDKFLMKAKFQNFGIPCANGKLISSISDLSEITFPVIVKPRDNSGSRGVKLCNNAQELSGAITEALANSLKLNVLVEDFIEGREFSIESLHHNGKSEIIQFTEKMTTNFPYNVELGHIQPANLTEEEKYKIKELISRIGKILKFENCASHTEIKINNKGIFVIETSPRLGGDYITSVLTPLSSGINMEDMLLKISLGEEIDTHTGRFEKASGIRFFNLPLGVIKSINIDYELFNSNPNVISFSFNLKVGDTIKPIKSSLDRYGHVIVKGTNFEEIIFELDRLENLVLDSVLICNI